MTWGLMPDQATSDSVCPGGRVRKHAIAPKPYPSEFRADVVRVTGNREPGMTIGQIAKDFGVHPMTLHERLLRADIEEVATPGQPRPSAAETREPKTWNQLLEQENEVLQRPEKTPNNW